MCFNMNIICWSTLLSGRQVLGSKLDINTKNRLSSIWKEQGSLEMLISGRQSHPGANESDVVDKPGSP